MAVERGGGGKSSVSARSESSDPYISEEMVWMLSRMQTRFVRAIAILDAARPNA